MLLTERLLVSIATRRDGSCRIKQLKSFDLKTFLQRTEVSGKLGIANWLPIHKKAFYLNLLQTNSLVTMQTFPCRYGKSTKRASDYF